MAQRIWGTLVETFEREYIQVSIENNFIALQTNYMTICGVIDVIFKMLKQDL